MIAAARLVPLTFAVVSALALGASALGCEPQVTTESGGDAGSGGSGGGGGSAGSGTTDPVTCTKWTADGCTPGDSQSCGLEPPLDTVSMGCLRDSETSCDTHWNYQDCNTPLVLAFDSAPVEYHTDHDHGFDLNGLASRVTDWPTAKTPWLAMDRDANGRIDDGGELFGSMTLLAGGGRGQNGFIALTELDDNGDGRITPEDAGFARLLVWADSDGDRRSAEGELTSVKGRGLLWIELGYTSEAHCDARGNCEVERASFGYRDATGVERTGTIIDVHLASQL